MGSIILEIWLSQEAIKNKRPKADFFLGRAYLFRRNQLSLAFREISLTMGAEGLLDWAKFSMIPLMKVVHKRMIPPFSGVENCWSPHHSTKVALCCWSNLDNNLIMYMHIQNPANSDNSDFSDQISDLSDSPNIFLVLSILPIIPIFLTIPISPIIRKNGRIGKIGTIVELVIIGESGKSEKSELLENRNNRKSSRKNRNYRNLQDSG